MRKYGMDLGEWMTPEEFFDDWNEKDYGRTAVLDED